MKICLYSNAFAPKIGGIETCSLSLATAWSALGHDVLVVSDTPAPPGYDEDRPFRMVRMPARGDWKNLLADRDVLVSNGHSLRYIREWRSSGVPFGWIHAMALRQPFTSIRVSLRLAFRRWATHLATFNICVSAAIKSDVAFWRPAIIPNPVSPMFRPLSDVCRGPRFLFFGRMWMPKGIDTLLLACDHCRTTGQRVEIDFYGDGEDRNEALTLANKLGLNDRVAFHPAARGEQLVKIINAAKAVVVPSRCREAFGLSAAEAMACGTCVIGALDGGLAEILADAALTFPPGDSQQLAQQLMRVQSSPALVKEFEVKGLQRSLAFNQITVAKEYITAFESLKR